MDSLGNHHVHMLGHRAFFLFLARRMKLIIFLFALTFAVWYSERWISSSYAQWGTDAALGLLVLSVAYFISILLLTLFEYRGYTYFFTDEALMVTQGYAERTETAALYHQIQNVTVGQTMLGRMAGVSKIVIFMNGDRDAAHNKIVLPAVAKSKAKLVQKEILVRARKHFEQGNPASREYSSNVTTSS